MTRLYATGYNGTVRTLEELEAWSGWQNLDPEFRRRALALMDTSIDAGRPLGIGGTYRSAAGQEQLFLSRHHVVSSGGCCTYKGKRYALNAGAAHAAVPGHSYHEGTTPDGKALAIDWTGDLAYLKANCAAYGLNEASTWSTHEPWHSQPAELPHSRSAYNPATMHPLRVAPFGATPTPAPVVPATVRRGDKNCTVALLQQKLGIYVDGDFGPKTEKAVRKFQKTHGLPVTGIAGPETWEAFG